jgi:DNA-binding MarR family transcriptional regulator
MNSNLEILERQIETASKFLEDIEVRSFHDDRFSELSVRKMLYLTTIHRMGHPTFSDLANELNVSRPSVTANVAALIRKGYLQKVQDHEDLRTYHILLTTKADEFNEMHQNVHKKLAQILAAQLEPGEVDQLTRLLEKALQGIQPK